MVRPKLHLDADASKISLYRALLARGYDVTRTPNKWMALDADDNIQLLGATAQGRSILTFNARDFIPLARNYPSHAGVILSPQHPMPRLLKALERFFNDAKAEEMQGQVRCLSDWES